jgi:hypothetical protein
MTPTPTIRIPFLLFSITVAAGGCGGGPFATDPGDVVLVENATAFTIDQSGGGFPAPIPQGAACDPGFWTYRVHLDTAQFDWDRCDVVGAGTDAASYMRSSGSRIMPAADLDAARSAARMVHVSGRSICGADKPSLHMTVSSPAGSKVYGDDFYSCTKEDDVYVVSDELDALSAQLHAFDQR